MSSFQIRSSGMGRRIIFHLLMSFSMSPSGAYSMMMQLQTHTHTYIHTHTRSGAYSIMLYMHRQGRTHTYSPCQLAQWCKKRYGLLTCSCSLPLRWLHPCASFSAQAEHMCVCVHVCVCASLTVCCRQGMLHDTQPHSDAAHWPADESRSLHPPSLPGSYSVHRAPAACDYGEQKLTACVYSLPRRVCTYAHRKQVL